MLPMSGLPPPGTAQRATTFSVAKSITVLVESGLRYHVTYADASGETSSKLIPLVGTLELTYR